MDMRIRVVFIISLLFFLGFPYVRSADFLERYLHKNARLDTGPPAELLQDSLRKPISPQQASLFAVQHLKTRGVGDIVICEAFWIAAPLSGYLIDALGKTTINGVRYTTFRVGIRDGLEEEGTKRPAGEVFVFIAYGRDSAGQSVWYPSPGPDYTVAQGEAITEDMLAYEFLLGRERFEALSTRYP
jgi:hypothetical protein